MDMMDLSLLDSLSSIAMTTQFAMMVMMMTQSKGGQLTSQVIIFLTGLVGVKRKREVGPRSSGSAFFFFLILTAQLTLGLQGNVILLWSGQVRSGQVRSGHTYIVWTSQIVSRCLYGGERRGEIIKYLL